MAALRKSLLQFAGDFYLTDGGIDHRHVERIAAACTPLFR